MKCQCLMSNTISTVRGDMEFIEHTSDIHCDLPLSAIGDSGGDCVALAFVSFLSTRRTRKSERAQIQWAGAIFSLVDECFFQVAMRVPALIRNLKFWNPLFLFAFFSSLMPSVRVPR